MLAMVLVAWLWWPLPPEPHCAVQTGKVPWVGAICRPWWPGMPPEPPRVGR